MNTMHRKIKIFALLICLIISFTACTARVEVDESSQNVNDSMDNVVLQSTEELVQEEEGLEDLPDPKDIYADFFVKVNPDNSFVIETNLPNETELSLTLKGKGYLAQGEAIVENGRAVSPVFTNRGVALEGDYTLEVLMPIPSVQSDYVKHFIGENGQYLKGEYIKPALTSIVVEKTFNVQLPGNVFVNNIQPGVEINYLDGTSKLKSENKLEKETEQENIKNENNNTLYILNTNTKKFHEEECSSVKDIKPKNKETFNGTKAWLMDNGYSPCGICKP